MELFADISITDIIDISIVSYVVYKLIMLLRGTRAVQLMKGIIVVLVAWALSVAFNLNTLQWIMNQMFTVGLIAIIIIFQPELRRALEQLGRGRLFSRSSMDVDQDVNIRIGEVIKAMNYLSRRKIGALIVFEKETGLTDYIESGIAIGGRISSELIINIFIPNTPLHDGAVIIRNNQLMAAGCYLPLSENPFISKELGTRHRAAIGMSEVSDAVCLIVSEETGQISLSLNGQVVRDIKEESLISKLFDELKPKANDRQNPFKKWWEGRKRG
ncbi:diadenylate cyclase CdaA [Paenibacillus chitinolyticus]|uniref:Diadenylate cyclase n=1 Tax=Paenibacillus chitinolyticus TaxID=79263 RepID=A0A410X493_9BACL|nr:MULTISPECIES: diadenylate cyclase CdaA [Paenibacillus]MCY9592296.1 diadenylate cyclase CdaA [Paenibacillus chitinolyticus]MCY9598008.1 diadenylate cyclase CdaA [Paenibacillus chitinolyticus]QAV21463.1 TIGR00159 family protein [Paenibacillus chitinolyticus]GKS10858.1 cyclic di-AMP synthase CdaA [Paenibacillus chitinolyticus]